MKKQLFLTLIAILTLTPKTSCSQKSSDAKESKARAQRNITVHVPENLGQRATLDLSEKSILTEYTFQELLDLHAAKGTPLPVARIVTESNKKPGTFHLSYYYAHALIKHLFGTYPLQVTHQGRSLYSEQNGYYKDPATGLPITQGIHYFSLDPENPQTGLTYLCSHRRLLQDDDEWRHRIYANQDANSNLQRESLDYFIKKGGDHWNKQKYEEALPYYALAAAQNSFLDLKAASLNDLGDVYGKLHKAEKQFACYQKAAQYTVEEAGLAAYTQTKFNLGTCYLSGTGTALDYKQARSVLETAYKHKETLRAQEQILIVVYLGDIELEAKNYAQAKQYYQPAVQQTKYQWAHNRAQKGLKEIEALKRAGAEQKESKQQTKTAEQTTGMMTSSTAPAIASAVTVTAAATVAASNSSTVTSTASASTTAATEQSWSSPAMALA